ncbi:hypothetical protein CC78DRAFT_543564 [Lojkania enalia]|uniref:Zn(2)-C6 fungal-type domain-containing protein n=1 Tax=Lojkania enalia TaxID=147567 RepID=A0A9P4KC33_9PLEO|nr:hypothetical protein CC78DRAFT_543564 [Didymosphaeria enalia]
MAELLGLAASIIQIAGFGAEVSTTLYNYIGSATRADQEIGDIAEDVQLTANALDSVGRIFETEDAKHVVSKKAIEDANNLIKRCEAVFGEIHGVINKRRKVGRDGKRSLSALGKFAWPLKEQRVELLRRRLESLKNSLILLFHVLQFANGQARGQLERSTLEKERENIRRLHQLQQDSFKSLKALENKLGNVSLDDGETLHGSSPASRVPTIDFMTRQPSKDEEITSAKDVAGKNSSQTQSTAAEDLTPSDDDDSTVTDEEGDLVTMTELANCAKHVQRLLTSISMLQQTFNAAQPSRRHRKTKLRKLYRGFCQEFESELLLKCDSHGSIPKSLSDPRRQSWLQNIPTQPPIQASEMAFEETPERESDNMLQDAVAVGTDALGVESAYLDWKEMNERKYMGPTTKSPSPVRILDEGRKEFVVNELNSKSYEITPQSLNLVRAAATSAGEGLKNEELRSSGGLDYLRQEEGTKSPAQSPFTVEYPSPGLELNRTRTSSDWSFFYPSQLQYPEELANIRIGESLMSFRSEDDHVLKGFDSGSFGDDEDKEPDELDDVRPNSMHILNFRVGSRKRKHTLEPLEGPSMTKIPREETFTHHSIIADSGPTVLVTHTLESLEGPSMTKIPREETFTHHSIIADSGPTVPVTHTPSSPILVVEKDPTVSASGRRLDIELFTPIQSPAVTLELESGIPDFTGFLGAYFSPLTSPALNAQEYQDENKEKANTPDCDHSHFSGFYNGTTSNTTSVGVTGAGSVIKTWLKEDTAEESSQDIKAEDKLQLAPSALWSTRPSNYTEARRSQRKSFLECVSCRSKHVECDGTMPCSRCEAEGLNCAFAKSPNRRRSPAKTKQVSWEPCSPDSVLPHTMNESALYPPTKSAPLLCPLPTVTSQEIQEYRQMPPPSQAVAPDVELCNDLLHQNLDQIKAEGKEIMDPFQARSEIRRRQQEFDRTYFQAEATASCRRGSSHSCIKRVENPRSRPIRMARVQNSWSPKGGSKDREVARVNESAGQKAERELLFASLKKNTQFSLSANIPDNGRLHRGRIPDVPTRESDEGSDSAMGQDNTNMGRDWDLVHRVQPLDNKTFHKINLHQDLEHRGSLMKASDRTRAHRNASHKLRVERENRMRKTYARQFERRVSCDEQYWTSFNEDGTQGQYNKSGVVDGETLQTSDVVLGTLRGENGDRAVGARRGNAGSDLKTKDIVDILLEQWTVPPAVS